MTNDDRAGEDPREQEAWVNRIAAPLRAQERLDDTFEARVMSAIHAEERAAHAQPSQDPGWWLRHRTLSISPLGALAAAAAIAGILAIGTVGLQSFVSDDATVTTLAAPAATQDTVHIVRFVYYNESAERVSLVADFNNWTKDEIRMDPGSEPGFWSASVVMPPGRHEYAFVIRTDDGERWDADPSSVTIRDEFGTETSFITVGSDATQYQSSVTS
jgi:anti-sigma factor RsiW